MTSIVEKQGATTLFSQSYVLNDDGTRASSHEVQLQSDGSIVATDTNWAYDAMDRLTGEAVTSSISDQSYSDVFAYDLNSNQITDVHTGTVGGAAGMTTNTYNNDDELITSTINGVETVNTYDPNGSETIVTVGGTLTTTYTYDVRNKMIAYRGSSGSATYLYNDDGNRVQETTGGVTTYYLTDTQNPTGYAQPIEQRNSPTSAPTLTYLIGDHIFGQASNSGAVSYLLTDGHGSTKQITNATGTVTEALAYTASGIALNFNPAAVGCACLFANDSFYDPISGLYMNGDGIRYRVGFQFIQADTQGNGSNSEPITLNRDLYAGADPINEIDPSGHFKISPSISRMLGALGFYVGLKALEGIEATYVLGNAYMNEVNSKDVQINMQIGRITDGDLPNGEFDPSFTQRPDILDLTLHTVYEIKTSALVSLGRLAVRNYLYTLGLRYPDETFTAGDWQPKGEYVLPGLPGIYGLSGIPIKAWNAGGGVIAYDDNGWAARTALTVAVVNGVIVDTADKEADSVASPLTAILICCLGGLF